MFGFRRSSTLVPLGHPPPQSGGIFGVGRRSSKESDAGEIHRAARAGSVWKVKQLLFFGKSRLHDRDGMRRTALHIACACGHPKVVTLLIERNCLLDLCDSKNRTALIQALEYQKEECAAILLDHGADPDVMDINGNTALHYAVLGQSKAIVEKLLAHEAHMNVRNKDGYTPLALAKRENRHQMVRLLIRRGAIDDDIESNQELSTENQGERQSVKCSERNDHDQEECLVEEIRITNSTTDQEECLVEEIRITNSTTDLQESSDKASRRRNSRRDLKKCFVEEISVSSSSRDLQESSEEASRRSNSKRGLLQCTKKAIRRLSSKRDLQESSEETSRRTDSKRDLLQSKKEAIKRPSSKRDLLQSTEEAVRRPSSKRDLLQSTEEAVQKPSSKRDLLQSTDEAVRRPSSKRDLLQSTEEAVTRPSSKRDLVQSTEAVVRRPNSKRDLLQSTEEAVRRPSSKRDLVQSTEAVVRRPNSKRDLLQSTEEAVRRPSSKRDLVQSTEAVVRRPNSKRDLLQSTEEAVRRPSSKRDLVQSTEAVVRRPNSKRDLLQSTEEAVRRPSSKRDLVQSTEAVVRRPNSKRDLLQSTEEAVRRPSSKRGLLQCTKKAIGRPSSRRDLQESSEETSRRTDSKRDLLQSKKEGIRRPSSKRDLLQSTEEAVRRPSSKRDLLPSAEEAVRRPSSKRDLLQSTDEAVRRPSSKRDLLQSTEGAVRRPSSKGDLLQSTEEAVRRPSSKRGLLQCTKKAIRRLSSKRDLQESSEETSRRTDSKRDLLQSKKEAIRRPSSKRVPQGSSKEVLGKTDSRRGGESSEEDSLRRLSSKPGINDSVPISHHEDFKDEVISKTYTPTAKTAENQSKQIHLPTLHLEKMSQDSEINRACDGEYTSAYSGHPSVQKHEEMWVKHGKFEQRKNLQLTSDELKQKHHEFCEKDTSECPEEGPLHHSKKGASVRQMPSNLTNKILDCGGKDSFGMPLSEVFQTFPGGEKPTLKNVFPSHSRSGPPEGSPWSSSSELCITEKKLHSENDHKPDTEHVLNKNEEPFCSDTENIKGRNPVVTSKVKEDQEFDMQMTKNMNPNTTNRKLGVRHTPQPSGLKSHLDLQIASHSEKTHMIQIKRHDTYAVTSTYKETKPNQDLLQKPLYADHCSASNYNKSMESEIQEWSSSDPCSVRTPTGCETEALEQDVQRLSLDMSKAEFLALRKRGRSSSDNLSVSDRYEKEESQLPEMHKLQDEIAVLRMEVDAVKNQSREMEKKYLKNIAIAIAKEKNDHLQKTIKLNKKTLRKTTFQYNGQLAALRAQNAMLNSKLENEIQNRERLEAEVESCRPRLATALQDCEQCPTSKKDIQFGCQRIRGEWFSYRDKMNLDMSDLKERNEILSQQLSKAERKFSSLEIELHHTRDAPRERTFVLESVERDLSKTKGRKTEIEHVYQCEQCKVNKHIAEQESLREKLRQLQSENMLLQSENMLLRQQLDDAHSQADSNKKTVVTILDELQGVRKTFHGEHDINALTNEWHHFKERIYKYENDNAERVAVVRQLQQDLADTKKKLSTLEASQKVESPYRMNLEDEKKKLKKELDESRSQHEKKHIRKWADLKSPLQSCLCEVLKKTGELEKELTRFKEILNITQRKLNEHENEELSSPEDLEQSLTEMEIQTNMLKQKTDDFIAILEPASSPCAHLDEENTLQQALPSVKAIQKKCEKLEDKKEKWKQKAKMLEKQMEMKMSEIEQYKQMIGTRAAQDLKEKLEQAQLLKTDPLPQQKPHSKVSLRRELEPIIEDMKSELPKLQKSDQLHQRENQCAKSLSSLLLEIKEKITEVKNELLRQKQEERPLHSTPGPMPD